MRIIFLVSIFVLLNLSTTKAFATDSAWEQPTGIYPNNFYWDNKNSYYKNGFVIVRIMTIEKTSITYPTTNDFQSFTFDKTISKNIFPCDKAKNWFKNLITNFFLENRVVFKFDVSSNPMMFSFAPGDQVDKFRNYTCNKLKPLWMPP